MKNNKHGEGTCPKCGSDNVEYYDSEYWGEELINYVCCCDCDFTFKEFSKVVYDGYSYEDENGEIHEFSSEDDEL